ncbi:hypothetical protein SELMODRAFT_430376 [Selaginella moellendorffii]|uniref:Uncharacterized protein n=1 Tax=Selaginella moellendorffii TaxID=88036 RepID=D8T980_SELML|nr:hypothetical protein SELMODRAFT_430376 [Selaginella moellendorffii]
MSVKRWQSKRNQRQRSGEGHRDLHLLSAILILRRFRSPHSDVHDVKNDDANHLHLWTLLLKVLHSHGDDERGSLASVQIHGEKDPVLAILAHNPGKSCIRNVADVPATGEGVSSAVEDESVEAPKAGKLAAQLESSVLCHNFLYSWSSGSRGAQEIADELQSFGADVWKLVGQDDVPHSLVAATGKLHHLGENSRVAAMRDDDPLGGDVHGDAVDMLKLAARVEIDHVSVLDEPCSSRGKDARPGEDEDAHLEHPITYLDEHGIPDEKPPEVEIGIEVQELDNPGHPGGQMISMTLERPDAAPIEMEGLKSITKIF